MGVAPPETGEHAPGSEIVLSTKQSSPKSSILICKRRYSLQIGTSNSEVHGAGKFQKHLNGSPTAMTIKDDKQRLFEPWLPPK